MNSEQFLAFARVFPEPLILLTHQGEVLAVNQATAKTLNCRRRDLAGQNLTDLVEEPPDKVLDYLQNCSRSRQFTIGSLTFLQSKSQNIICRIEGAVVQPKSDETPAISLLRLEKREAANSEFLLLNKKIEQLAQEIQQRQKAEAQLQQKNQVLQETLAELKNTQTQLIQTEKMSSLGQLVAGLAHEINNPVSFIHGNLEYADSYCYELLNLVNLYQTEYPQPSVKIQDYLTEIDFDFLVEDIDRLLKSMRVGTQRILGIVKSLRSFSRLDEAQVKKVDLHEGIESTLMILQHRLQNTKQAVKIEVIKEYDSLPKIDCHPSQINQVFMNLLSNAIDALTEAEQQKTPAEIKENPSRIWIQTEMRDRDFVTISIKDNGLGIPPEIQSKIFDPFFTTKKIGKGTGLGLSISYQIITEMHKGELQCYSLPGYGTEFIIQLPLSSLRSISLPSHQPKSTLVSQSSGVV